MSAILSFSRHLTSKVYHAITSPRNIKRLFPIISWIPTYSLRHQLLGDLIAGISVGMMVVPQSLAYAALAGLPVQYGLYSSFMANFAYFFFGTSRTVTVGPTAVLSLIIGQALAQIDHEHPAVSHFVATACIAFLSGCFLLVLGLFRLGFLLDLIPGPVIKGFTSGAAIVILISQLPGMLGIPGVSPRGKPYMVLADTFASMGRIKWNNFAFGVATLVFCIVTKWIRNRLVASGQPKMETVLTRQGALNDPELFAGSALISNGHSPNQPQQQQQSLGKDVEMEKRPDSPVMASVGKMMDEIKEEGDNDDDDDVDLKAVKAPSSTTACLENLDGPRRRNSTYLGLSSIHHKDEEHGRISVSVPMSPSAKAIKQHLSRRASRVFHNDTAPSTSSPMASLPCTPSIERAFAFASTTAPITFNTNANTPAVESGNALHIPQSSHDHVDEMHIITSDGRNATEAVIIAPPVPKRLAWLKTVGNYVGVLQTAIAVVLMTLAALAYYRISKADHDAAHGIAKDELPVAIIRRVPAGLPHPRVPQLSSDVLTAIGFNSVIGTAIIAILEQFSIAKAHSRLDGERIDPSQEMVALGVGNILGSFFGACTVGGSFSRTPVNRASGATSPVAGVITSFIVILAMLLLPPLFYYMPSPALSAIIFANIMGLVSMPGYYLEIAKYSRTDALASLLAFVVTIFSSPEVGIAVSVGFSLLALLLRIARPKWKIVDTLDEDHVEPLAKSPKHKADKSTASPTASPPTARAGKNGHARRQSKYIPASQLVTEGLGSTTQLELPVMSGYTDVNISNQSALAPPAAEPSTSLAGSIHHALVSRNMFDPDDHGWTAFVERHLCSGLVVFRLEESLIFPNAEYVRHKVTTAAKRQFDAAMEHFAALTVSVAAAAAAEAEATAIVDAPASSILSPDSSCSANVSPLAKATTINSAEDSSFQRQRQQQPQLNMDIEALPTTTSITATMVATDKSNAQPSEIPATAPISTTVTPATPALALAAITSTALDKAGLRSLHIGRVQHTKDDHITADQEKRNDNPSAPSCAFSNNNSNLSSSAAIINAASAQTHKHRNPLSAIVFDLSAVNHIDASGIQCLNDIEECIMRMVRQHQDVLHRHDTIMNSINTSAATASVPSHSQSQPLEFHFIGARPVVRQKLIRAGLIPAPA